MPVCDIGSLPIGPRFQEKLREFSITGPFWPMLPDDLRQLGKTDDGLVMVERRSDNRECFAPLALVNNNLGKQFKRQGLFRQKIIWDDR